MTGDSAISVEAYYLPDVISHIALSVRMKFAAALLEFSELIPN